MRRVIFSFALLGSLLAAVVSGSSSVGASTTNSSAQLTYSTSSEKLQNLGTVNLSAIAAGFASVTPSANSASVPLNHPLPVDSENRPNVTSTSTAVVSPGKLESTANPNTKLPGFEGISGPQQAAVNGGGDLEPPDQGTCAGADASGNPRVGEIINNALSMYTPSGTQVLPVIPTYALFNQPSTAFLSDPRCSYDAATQRWFFTEFVVGSSSATPHNQFAPSTQFVAVSTSSDPLGNYKVFGIDTTDLHNKVGDCPCFGDFDQIGFDANGMYITTNEFSTGNAAPGFNGTVMYAISKQGLAAAADGSSFPSVTRYAITGDAFGSSGGSQPYHVSPASTPAGGAYAPNTEYFVESNSNAFSDNHLIVYALTGTNQLASGGTPLLQATDVTSEAYSFPPDATQAPGPLTLGPTAASLGSGFFSSSTPQGLQNDFNAVQQVTYTSGRLYAELDTSVGPVATATSAAAWFKISPSVSSGGVNAQIEGQGYVASTQNILYPDIVVGPSGNGYIAFAVSGSTTWPSAAYTTFSANEGPGSSIVIEQAGAAPEDGFTCYITGYGGCRWGDYSGGAVWNGTAYLMTEYIPSSPRDTFTNWGTFVWSGPVNNH
jgi:hypothetical protein